MAVGDPITATRYNNLQTRIATIFGNGSGTDGYGQSVASGQVSVGDTVTAVHINDIVNDMVKARTHQLGSSPTTVSTVAVGDLIAENTSTNPNGTLKGLADFESLMSEIESGKFLIAGSQSTAATGISNSSSSSWNGTRTHEVRMSFSNSNTIRHFFNSGGELRTSASLTGGSGAKGSDWATMLSNMGTIKMNYTQTTSTGTGSGSSIGFYDLSASYQTIFTKSGSGVYAENDYIVQARSSSSTTVDFKILFQDDDAGDQTGLGPGVDENVTGTLASTVSYLRASGSNVSVAAPAFSNTTTY
jgi:hypothetical protein